MTQRTSIRPRRAALTLAASAAMSLAPLAIAQHAGDIVLEVTDGRIVTGHDRGDGLTFPQVVIPAVFGDTGIHNFTSNPGFDSLPGTFTPSTRTGFNILAPLRVWNGDGFDAPATGESLTISFSSLEVTTGDGFVPGFGLLVSGSGVWHRHLNYTLNGSGGDDPVPGVYLLELELWNDAGDVQSSDPFFLVFNYEVSNETHEAAIAWMDAAAAGAICPDEAIMHRGLVVSGGPEDLCQSDDARWTLRSDSFLSTLVAPVDVELIGTSPTPTPSSITFAVEAAASATGVHLRIELYNVIAARWERTFVLDLPQTDTVFEVTRAANAGEYVDADSRMRARLAAFRPLGIPPLWNVAFDRATWTVE